MNLQNLFASFYNDPKADVMNMSWLDMFLIMTPINFIGYTVIKKKNERLDVPMTTQEYIQKN